MVPGNEKEEDEKKQQKNKVAFDNIAVSVKFKVAKRSQGGLMADV